MVRAKYGMSADVEKLSSGGQTKLGCTTAMTVPPSGEGGKGSVVSKLPAGSIYERATNLRRSRKERGRANLVPDGSSQTPKLEPDSGHGTLGSVPVQKRLGQRFRVVVTSYRKRLLDDDNLCEKYLVDLCRYSGAIPDDAPGTTRIEVRQQKVEGNEQERTTIEIFKVQ